MLPQPPCQALSIYASSIFTQSLLPFSIPTVKNIEAYSVDEGVKKWQYKIIENWLLDRIQCRSNYCFPLIILCDDTSSIIYTIYYLAKIYKNIKIVQLPNTNELNRLQSCLPSIPWQHKKPRIILVENIEQWNTA